MLEKLSKMSVREAMITLAGGPPAYGELPRWLSRIAHQANISFRTARSLWLNEIKNPDHLAAREIKRLAMIAEANREARDLASTYETIAAGSAHADHSNLHSADTAALVHAARILRGLDRA